MSPTVGIAFEGCACAAAFHIGVAQALQERGVEPHCIAGASSGSLVAAAWSVDRLDDLETAWLELVQSARPFEIRKVLQGHWPGRMSHVLRDGLQTAHGDITMDEAPRLRIAVTHFGRRGRRVRVLGPQDTDVRVVDAILASCFIPGPYSRPVRIDGKIGVDGAWLDRCPIDALEEGPRIAVVTNPAGVLNQGFLRIRQRPWPTDVMVIHPPKPLAARGFRFDVDAARQAMDEGRRAVQDTLLAKPPARERATSE